MSKSYDIIVIGGGPAGYYAAIRASQLGLKIALVEMDKLGGTCANYGCIPTKSYYASARLLNFSEKASEFGLSGKPLKPDMKAILERKDNIVNKLVNGIKMLLKKNKVDIFEGRASLLPEKKVELFSGKKSEKLSSGNIIISTGSIPSSVPGISYDGKKILTSKDILSLNRAPSSLLIIGGGVIGIEMACIFNAFGSKVVIVEMLPEIIPSFDTEISVILKKRLVSQGIEVCTSSKVEQVKISDDKVKVKISMKTGSKNFTVSNILVSAGRQANMEGIGLEKIGLDKKAKCIEVNDRMQTSVNGIYAAGDVTARGFLAYIASAQGLTAAEEIAGEKTVYDESIIPACIWSHPEVASVGLTEDEAKKKGFSVALGKFPFHANGKALAMGEADGFVKAVIDKKYDHVLGVHIIGPEAANLISEPAMALKCEATVNEFDRISHVHPALSEAVMEAVNDAVGRAIDK